MSTDRRTRRLERRRSPRRLDENARWLIGRAEAAFLDHHFDDPWGVDRWAEFLRCIRAQNPRGVGQRTLADEVDDRVRERSRGE